MDKERPQGMDAPVPLAPGMDKERPQGMDAQVPLAPGMDKERPAIFITVSIGVAGYRFSDEPDTAGMIIQRADQALYQAKEEGRNRVISCNGDKGLS
jgi:GGDEF domain-containing protein